MPTQSSFKIIVVVFFVKIMSGMRSGSFLSLTFSSFKPMCVSRMLYICIRDSELEMLDKCCYSVYVVFDQYIGIRNQHPGVITYYNTNSM